MSMISDMIADVYQIAFLLISAIIFAIAFRHGYVCRIVYRSSKSTTETKERAGFAIFWRYYVSKEQADMPPTLTIIGLLWKGPSGHSTFHIGRHEFNLMPGYIEDRRHLFHKFGIFYNPPKDP